MATYVIGDIHACLPELQALLQQINFRPGQDNLWCIGDLVNNWKPKASLATLQYLMEQGASSVLGNHELALFRCVANGEAYYPKRVLTWLKQQPLAHYLPAFDTLLVHAGVAPQWSLAQVLRLAGEVSTVLCSAQAKHLLMMLSMTVPYLWHEQLQSWGRWHCILNYLVHVRYCSADGRPHLGSKGKIAPPGCLPWYLLPERRTAVLTIVFGHWSALRGVSSCDNALAIDTGCMWGGALTALRLEDRVRFSVPSTSAEQHTA
jgi:bis(5'-nucleosyl)-tetraphosphatase (symmetrical)